MSKYIDADKLRAKLEKRLKNVRDYINGAGMKYKGPKYFKAQGKESAYDAQLNIIDSLQQEHPEGGCSEKPNDLLSKQEPTCKTCSYYENDCPFTRGKLMVYPNKVCKDYTHSAMKQEQLGVRCEPSLPSNLDEAAEEFGKRQGVELAPFARKFFKAGAEWVAGQFQKIEGDLVDWHSTSDGKEYCCGIKTDEAFEIPEGFYIQKKQQPGESLKENEDGNK